MVQTSCGADTLPVIRGFGMTRGDTFSRGLLVRCGGVPLMLGSGGSCCFALFSGGSVIMTKKLTSADQDSEGRISFGLTPSDTETLEPGEYSYELEMSLADGTVMTPLAGVLTVRADEITPEVRADA